MLWVMIFAPIQTVRGEHLTTLQISTREGTKASIPLVYGRLSGLFFWNQIGQLIWNYNGHLVIAKNSSELG